MNIADYRIGDEPYPGGWFGPSWGAPVCTPETHKPTPVDEPCMACARLIREGEQGLIMPHVAPEGSFLVNEHIACFRRTVGVSS